jgi:hypothetical protein
LKKSILDALRAFYGDDIEFRIVKKRDIISEEIQQIFRENIVDTRLSGSFQNLIAAREKLEKEIVKSKSELKNAKKKFKRGEMDRDTLFEFEYRLIELKNQLEDILDKIKRNDREY